MDGEYIIEMEWRCACGAVNPGLTLGCTECGRPKGKANEDMMPADTSERAAITDPEKLRRAESGPAWPCPYCEQAAPAGAPCPRCGAPEPGSGFTVGGRPATWPRWAAPRAPVVDVEVVEDRLAELPAPPSPHRIPVPARSVPRSPSSDTWTRRALHLLPAIVGALLLLGVVGVLVRACQTREISGTVTGIAWTNTVVVDRWEATPGEGWEAPFGAERVHVIDPHRPHGTHPVFDHEEWVDDPHAPTDCGQVCTPGKPATPATPAPAVKGKPVCVPLGNGTARCKAPATSTPASPVSPPTPSVCKPKPCPPPPKVKVTITREEPTYDAWLGWNTWDWTLNVRRSFEQGEALPTRWPDPPPVALGPGERERSRREGSYRVTIAAEGRTYTVRPRDEDHLLRFPVGGAIVVRVDGFGSLTSTTPEP